MLQNVVYRFKCIIGRLLASLIDAVIFVLAYRDGQFQLQILQVYAPKCGL
jgi:hypothetical protein